MPEVCRGLSGFVGVCRGSVVGLCRASVVGVCRGLSGFGCRASVSVARCPMSGFRCPGSVTRCPLSDVRCPVSGVRVPLPGSGVRGLSGAKNLAPIWGIFFIYPLTITCI